MSEANHDTKTENDDITKDDLRLALAEAGAAISENNWDQYHAALNELRSKGQRADFLRGGSE